ncbi:MAG: DUF6279 family lipoprotein [Burkholderiales bacterium]|nr:DUF6279 family lipoprotein [Burkholderiales bacterium]
MFSNRHGIDATPTRAGALAERDAGMFGDPWRTLRFCGSVLAALALAGCGTAVRVAYNQGDIAVRLAAHEYLDLHGEQPDVFRAQLKGFHAWHRAEELPKYADLLDAMAVRVQRGLTREDVQWATAAVRERMRVLTAQAVEDAGPVLVMLDADNVRALEKKLAANNAKFAADYLTGDARKDERNRARRIRENFEDWFGDLSDEQEALIEAYVRASPRITAAMFEDRKRRQREFVELLKAHRGSPEITARVRAFVVEWEAQRGPEYARLAREQEERFAELLLSIDRTLSPRQRRHAVDRLALYAREFSVLAAQGRGAPKGAQRAAVAGELAR